MRISARFTNILGVMGFGEGAECILYRKRNNEPRCRSLNGLYLQEWNKDKITRQILGVFLSCLLETVDVSISRKQNPACCQFVSSSLYQ